MNGSTKKSQRRMQRARALAFGLGLLLLEMAGGCSDDGPPRYPFSGSVTLDGKPLTEGSITFSPVDGPLASSADVHNGVFNSSRSTGTSAGKYQVEINAIQQTGKRVPHPDFPGESIDEVRNLIPARYNVKSQLTVEVKPDAKNDFTFQLTSLDDTKKTKKKRR